MFWFKRLLSGVLALFLVFLGITLFSYSEKSFQLFGAAVFVCGIILGYIVIRRRLPSYNFWITIIAIGLAYQVLNAKAPQTENMSPDNIDSISETSSSSRNTLSTGSVEIVKKHKKASNGFNLKAYPKITGSANVIHAHVFYVAGRYVRLFGVDAPDNDQLCSDVNGSSYNCGEVAVSWVRNWIDKNPIDCYLLKIDPKGYDLATCMWGEYDIGAGLVGAGWGLAKTKESRIYKPYEAKAQSESLGLWQGTFYTPEDWRDIKRHRNDFTIKTNSFSSGGGFFGSLFKW